MIYSSVIHTFGVILVLSAHSIGPFVGKLRNIWEIIDFIADFEFGQHKFAKIIQHEFIALEDVLRGVLVLDQPVWKNRIGCML